MNMRCLDLVFLSFWQLQIQALFIAPNNDLVHSFDYGYVTHNGQQGLTKLDLDNMRYVKAVDLSAYDCVPHSLAFVPIGESSWVTTKELGPNQNGGQSSNNRNAESWP